MSLSVVLLACDGLYQRDLARCIAERHRLQGVVVHGNPQARGGILSRLGRHLSPTAAWQFIRNRQQLRRDAAAAAEEIAALFQHQGRWPDWPDVAMHRCQDINDPSVADFVSGLAPDVVCVNGTNLLRAPLRRRLSGLNFGILNLHTGLSPYARGGNCNLWVLLERQPERVGITVHYIDGGIDRGDILLTARPALRSRDTYQAIDARGFHLGNRELVRGLDLLEAGCAPRVRQWTAGTLYLKKHGYLYSPAQVALLNRRLASGWIDDYLAAPAQRDAQIRLIRETDASTPAQ